MASGTWSHPQWRRGRGGQCRRRRSHTAGRWQPAVWFVGGWSVSRVVWQQRTGRQEGRKGGQQHSQLQCSTRLDGCDQQLLPSHSLPQPYLHPAQTSVAAGNDKAAAVCVLSRRHCAQDPFNPALCRAGWLGVCCGAAAETCRTDQLQWQCLSCCGRNTPPPVTASHPLAAVPDLCELDGLHGCHGRI
jgi:hypothetical protein